MTIQYTVEAFVVDIDHDEPKTGDKFIVDTNVWYWTHYIRASDNAQHYQVTSYPFYIRKAIKAKAQLYRFGLSFAELAHVIENNEFEAYVQASEDVTSKEFRHNYPDIRTNIVAEIEDAWTQIKRMSLAVDVLIDEARVTSVLTNFKTYCVDGYDLFFLEAMKANGLTNIITDDGNFITVSGITVFTANRNVLSQAREQGKLLVR